MSFRLALLVAVLALAGCGAHPGAATWMTSSENSLSLAKLVVHFEGRAELLNSAGDELYRCFWAATDKVTLDLTCTQAEDTDAKQPYQLVADGESATLLEAGKVVAQLSRLPE